MKNTMKITTQGECAIVITRAFDAPRALVWEALTRPELVRRWLLGPPGWTMPVCEIDLRVGGKYRYVWRNQDGMEMGMGGEYREIVRPERLVATEAFDQSWYPGHALDTTVLVEKDGITTSTLTVLYDSREARDAVLKSPMEQGMAAGYDRLAELLASMGPRTRGVGEFCWINMLTPRPADARAFFGKLLGWTYAEIPGMGHRVQVGGRDIGGLFDLAGPNTPPGTPPCIGVMVKVESADATAAQASALGGKAMPPFDIMDQGRMAVCFDPNGANIDVWEPKKSHGSDCDAHQHGAPCWFETLTTDVDRATVFYSGLFGWKPEVMAMPGYNYTVFKLGNCPVAGMMQITPQMGNFPPHWGVYFTTNDVDESARLAAELGARLCVPVRDIPGVGRFAGITSPQGVTFYVIKYNC